MKKRNLVFAAVSVLTIAAAATGVAVSNSSLSMIRANEEVTWNHYSAVAPTLRTKGSKEYWVSCNTHEHQFTAPSVDPSQIVEKGAPSEAFIDGLTQDDDRAINKVTKLFDFEDGVVPTEFEVGSNVNSFEINASEGTNGSKCLQVNIKGSDYFLTINKAYMDKVFADTTVQSIAFDAKATKNTENWRHRTAGNDPIYEEYQYGNSQNKVYDGLNTTYKTFYFTRAFYNSWQTGDSLIKGGDLTSADKLYIDNVRAITYASGLNTNPRVDFESGCAYRQWDSKSSAFTNNWTVRGTTGQVAFVSGAGAETVDFSYDYKTDGNRSLHIKKQNGYLAIYLSANFYNSLTDAGFMFDIYTSTDMALYGNDNQKFFPMQNGWGNPAGSWETYHLPKSAIGSDGRFLILQGSPAPDVYIDNIRAASCFDSFEGDDYATPAKISDYLYCTRGSLVTNDTEGAKVRDTMKSEVVLVNGAAFNSMAITDEKCTDGFHSLKFTCTSGAYLALFLDPQVVNKAYKSGFAVVFDFYATVGFTSEAGIGAQVNANCINKWGTITISGDALLDPAKAANGANGRVYCSNTKGAGTFYIDNFRVVPVSE